MKAKFILIAITLVLCFAFVSCSDNSTVKESYTDIDGNVIETSISANSSSAAVVSDFSLPQETINEETTLKVTSTILGDESDGKDMLLAYETEGKNAPQYINFVVPAERGESIPVIVTDSPSTQLDVKCDLLESAVSISTNETGYGTYSLLIPEDAQSGYHTISFSNNTGTLTIKFFIK